MTAPVAPPLRYAGFGRRFAALLLDFLLAPWTLLGLWLMQRSRAAALYDFLPQLLLSVLFHIVLVVRYGGTPGKLLMKLRITMVDGSPVTAIAAFWRHSVNLAVQLASAAALLPVIAAMSDADYLGLDFMARSSKLLALAPAWFGALTRTRQLWMMGELASLLLNKRRRSLHDLMAGTVVVTRPASAEPAIAPS